MVACTSWCTCRHEERGVAQMPTLAAGGGAGSKLQLHQADHCRPAGALKQPPQATAACLGDLGILGKLEKLGAGAVQIAGGLPRQPACS